MNARSRAEIAAWRTRTDSSPPDNPPGAFALSNAPMYQVGLLVPRFQVTGLPLILKSSALKLKE